MKRFVSMLLALVMVCCLLPTVAFAAEVASGTCGFCEECYGAGECGDCSDNLTWTLDGNGVLTISGTGKMPYCGEEGETAPWYAYKDSIKSVVIEEGVTSVGTMAFYCYSGLTSVTLPSTLQRIDTNAFTACDIVRLEIPAGVVYLGAGSFADCEALEHVTLPCCTEYISMSAFSDCVNLSSIDMTAMDPYAPGSSIYMFSRCDSLTDLSFYTAKAIGAEMFSGCDGFTVLEIPEGVESIGASAFKYCVNLTSVTMPSTLTEMGNWLFWGSDALTEIWFTGDAPACMEGHIPFDELETTAYYPANNATWTEEAMASYGGTITWVSYEPDSSDEVIVATWEELKAAIARAEASTDPEQVFTIKWDMWRVIEVGESIEIPENCVFNPGCILIPEGVTLTVPGGFSTISGIEVSGKLVTPDLFIQPEVGGQLYITETGSVDIPYIRITDTEAPETNRLDDILYGLDQSLYNVEEVGYGDWVLTLKAAEIPGDTDGDGSVDEADVAQLLWYTLFPDAYTVVGNADFNADNAVDEADVAYLLWHTLFPDAYPLN
ncbi:MAG: leucine-rich repeat protein [Oscillospiraceae bacterium]|nr:leucine-rich repeat protein [Oscillospiraceae bacterium]